MKLYKIETKGLGTYHIVANHPTEAENRLVDLLTDADYGFTEDRRVQIITLISDEVFMHGGNPKPFFSDKNKLILPESCKNVTT